MTDISPSTNVDTSPLALPSESVEHPMIVWLQGDESYFSEFSVDADEAMKHLGIKRSRLTQISGKELRVGRTKVDRYIKPLYRMVDIEEYLAWSKAPTTTKKASDTVQLAVMELAKQSEQFSTKMEEPFLDIKELLEDQNHVLEDQAEALNKMLQMSKDLDETKFILQKMFKILSKKVEQQFFDTLKHVTNTSDLNDNRLHLLEESLQKLRQICFSMQSELTSQIVSQQSKLTSLHQSVSNLEDQFKTWDIKMDTWFKQPSPPKRMTYARMKQRRQLQDPSKKDQSPW